MSRPDDELLDAVLRVWEKVDPPPEDLAPRLGRHRLRGDDHP